MSDIPPILPRLADLAQFLSHYPWHPHRALRAMPEPLGERIRRLRALHAKSRINDPEFHGRLVTYLFASRPEPLRRLAVDLLIENDQAFPFPDIPNRSFSAEEAEALTTALDEIETRLANEEAIREHFHLCIKKLVDAYAPLFPDEASHLTVPLISPDIVAHVLNSFTGDFWPVDSIKALSLKATRERLIENTLGLSRLTLEQFEKNPHKIIAPGDYDGDLEDYVDGTALLPFFRTQVPFVIPRPLWYEHAAMFAPSGHGKTQALQAIILDFLQSDCPALFIIDSHGDMLRKIRALNPPNLVVIDPEAPEPPALNFLDFKGNFADVVELFGYLMSALSADLSAAQSTMVAFILRLVAAIPDATLDTLRRIMEDPAKTVDKCRFAKEIAGLDPIAQDYFANQFFTSGNIAVTKSSVARRIYALMANPTFAKMFSATRNTFDAFQAMEDKKIVLINTSMKLLRAEASSVFGRYMLAQILAAAYRRADIPEKDRHLALVIVDEAAPYMDHTTERILTETRKFGVSLLLATQFLEQLPNSVKAAVNGNTSIKFAGPVSYTDANALGREMYTTGDFLRSTRKTADHTEFACYVKTVTPAAVRVTISFGVMEDAPPFADFVGDDGSADLPAATSSPSQDEIHDAAPAAIPVAPASSAPDGAPSSTQASPATPPGNTLEPDTNDPSKPTTW